jgi:hypothetical protein
LSKRLLDLARGDKLTNTNSRRDDDSAWKTLVKKFFYEMLQRCIPDLYEAADRSRAPNFLDKELRAIGQGVKKRKRTVDFLVSVPLKDNSPDEILFLHLEVQGRGGGSLPERMFRYMALIYAMWGKNVAALAIMTDKRSRKEPEFYESSLFGTRFKYEYNRLVIPELCLPDLVTSENPFDLALYAARKASLSRDDEKKKHVYLRELLDLLSARGWSHEEKYDLLFFMEPKFL